MANKSTKLDFEDLAPRTTVTTQYGPRGVLFRNHFLTTDPAAHSGTRVLRTVKPSDEVFTPVPLVMTFTSPQARIRLFAKAANIAANGTLFAFNASGRVVAKDGPKLVLPTEFTTVFNVIDLKATPSIVRVELRLENSAHFAIDDLEFEAELSAQVTEFPQRKITDDPTIVGNLEENWTVAVPAEMPSQPPGVSPIQGAFALLSKIRFAPLVEVQMSPGDSQEVELQVAGPSILLGSVRWIGTTDPLTTNLLFNGAGLETGTTHSFAGNRGGCTLNARTTGGGRAALSVTNTSAAVATVKIVLGALDL